MPASETITYPDTLFFDALLREINQALTHVEVMTFVFKTGYAEATRAEQVKDALIAAAQRGLDVFVVLNYSRFEPDVAEGNYATAQALAAAGCIVRLGPRNQTLHTKLAIFDLSRVFIGSHNLTRGALSFNRELTVFSETREMAKRAARYFNTVWAYSTRFEETPPPGSSVAPVVITLASATAVGSEVELGFSVNHTTGVDAFAAVADSALNLVGATMGPTVAATERAARVTPIAEAGTTVYLAVRAYRQGAVEATSNIVSMTYQPAEEPGGGEPGEGGGEPPAPEPLTAPTLTSVTQASPTTVTVAWTFAGCANFVRFVVEQRDLEQNWHQVGVTMDEQGRSWTGAPNTMDTVNPFRIVVYNTAGESATSNEVVLAVFTPALQAPVLTVVETVTLEQIHVEWTYVTPEDFHRCRSSTLSRRFALAAGMTFESLPIASCP